MGSLALLLAFPLVFPVACPLALPRIVPCEDGGGIAAGKCVDGWPAGSAVWG